MNGSFVEPRSQDQSPKCSGTRPVCLVGCTDLTSVRQRLSETSKQRTRIGIARLVSMLSEVRLSGIRLMVTT
jgi:hypothetical protein